MGSLKTALPVGLGGILAKQQDVFRHPDNGQRCRISLLRLGYIFVFLCGLFTLGFGEIGEASRFSFFSGTHIAVDEEELSRLWQIQARRQWDTAGVGRMEGALNR